MLAVPLVKFVVNAVKFSYPAVPVEGLFIVPNCTLPIFSSAVLLLVEAQ